jgi:TRAP-type uncharacterized transport system fused permease subunit
MIHIVKVIENVIKQIWTTILGLVGMSLALYGWWEGTLTTWEAGGLATIGFALLFMRDEIPGFIKMFINAAIKKFKGGSKE